MEDKDTAQPKYNYTVEKVDLGLADEVEFTLHDAAPDVPVLDIGELLAAVFTRPGELKPEYVTLGEENSTFVVYLKNSARKNAIMAGFGPTSFSPIPENTQPAHQAGFKRFSINVTDPAACAQFQVPMSIPHDLLYVHDKAAWGHYGQDNAQLFNDKQYAYDLIHRFVQPIRQWANISGVDY